MSKFGYGDPQTLAVRFQSGILVVVNLKKKSESLATRYAHADVVQCINFQIRPKVQEHMSCPKTQPIYTVVIDVLPDVRPGEVTVTVIDPGVVELCTTARARPL